jgi:type III secretory pathway component EscT
LTLGGIIGIVATTVFTCRAGRIGLIIDTTTRATLPTVNASNVGISLRSWHAIVIRSFATILRIKIGSGTNNFERSWEISWE